MTTAELEDERIRFWRRNSIQIGVANIGRGNVPTTRRAIRRVVRTLGVGESSFLLLQEVHHDAIDEPRFINRLLDRLETAYEATEHALTGVRRTFAIRSQPIFDRAPLWKRTGRDKIEVYGGIEKVTAACWIAAAYYRHRATGEKLAVLNLHLMHSPEKGGLNERLWDEGWAALRETVHRLVDDGYDVIVGGDFNIRGWLRLPLEDLHPNAVEVARHGLDRIVAIPSHGRTVRQGKARNSPLPVERQHDLLVVRVRFTTRRRRTR